MWCRSRSSSLAPKIGPRLCSKDGKVVISGTRDVAVVSPRGMIQFAQAIPKGMRRAKRVEVAKMQRNHAGGLSMNPLACMERGSSR